MANKERVALGIAALRSRNEDGTPVYPKGRMVLHRITPEGDKWCCLGVLSKIAVENGCPVAHSIIKASDYSLFANQDIEVFGEDDQFLAPEIQHWYGFDSNNPLLETPGGPNRATHWNDHGRDMNSEPEEDFTTIADAFERTYLEEE
jgi:hypothetical protein